MSNLVRPFPGYREHKTGQAFVTVNGRDFYLGKFKAAESYERYNQLQFEWMANGRMLTDSNGKFAVVQIAAAYKEFAKSYYVKNGQASCLEKTTRRK